MRQLWWFILCEIISIFGVFIITYYITKRNKQRNSANDVNNMSLLIHGLAHEIRNPLNTMDSNLQLLEEDLEFVRGQNRAQQITEPQIEVTQIFDKLKRVRSEIENLDQILRAFLRYADLAKPQVEKCDLKLLIEEELNFIEPEAQRQGITLIRKLEPLPEVWVDTSQLKQALLNLIINANQAMEKGGTLTITTKLINEQIRIDVKDTGSGIPPERQEKIFDLFYSTKEEGTGVGLAIVKRVIEGHGGKITVSSEVGKGTTFSIFLPLNLPH
ncbi:TPA: hypothetical protein EYP66_06300 [Candidatus Poribacteria bacterium]|nr:hypothetical protein [Candidatus Poribacteria bacterium]